MKNIDHLRIVTGLIDKIGIVETINSKLGIDGREKISLGTVVKAILINGLGFVSRPLYLFIPILRELAFNYYSFSLLYETLRDGVLGASFNN